MRKLLVAGRRNTLGVDLIPLYLIGLFIILFGILLIYIHRRKKFRKSLERKSQPSQNNSQSNGDEEIVQLPESQNGSRYSRTPTITPVTITPVNKSPLQSPYSSNRNLEERDINLSLDNKEQAVKDSIIENEQIQQSNKLLDNEQLSDHQSNQIDQYKSNKTHGISTVDSRQVNFSETFSSIHSQNDKRDQEKLQQQSFGALVKFLGLKEPSSGKDTLSLSQLYDNLSNSKKSQILERVNRDTQQDKARSSRSQSSSPRLFSSDLTFDFDFPQEYIPVAEDNKQNSSGSKINGQIDYSGEQEQLLKHLRSRLQQEKLISSQKQQVKSKSIEQKNRYGKGLTNTKRNRSLELQVERLNTSKRTRSDSMQQGSPILCQSFFSENTKNTSNLKNFFNSSLSKTIRQTTPTWTREKSSPDLLPYRQMQSLFQYPVNLQNPESQQIRRSWKKFRQWKDAFQQQLSSSKISVPLAASYPLSSELQQQIQQISSDLQHQQLSPEYVSVDDSTQNNQQSLGKIMVALANSYPLSQQIQISTGSQQQQQLNRNSYEYMQQIQRSFDNDQQKRSLSLDKRGIPLATHQNFQMDQYNQNKALCASIEQRSPLYATEAVPGYKQQQSVDRLNDPQASGYPSSQQQINSNSQIDQLSPRFVSPENSNYLTQLMPENSSFLTQLNPNDINILDNLSPNKMTFMQPSTESGTGPTEFCQQQTSSDLQQSQLLPSDTQQQQSSDQQHLQLSSDQEQAQDLDSQKQNLDQQNYIEYIDYNQQYDKDLTKAQREQHTQQQQKIEEYKQSQMPNSQKQQSAFETQQKQMLELQKKKSSRQPSQELKLYQIMPKSQKQSIVRSESQKHPSQELRLHQIYPDFNKQQSISEIQQQEHLPQNMYSESESNFKRSLSLDRFSLPQDTSYPQSSDIYNQPYISSGSYNKQAQRENISPDSSIKQVHQS